jgi:hypothetical protein
MEPSTFIQQPNERVGHLGRRVVHDHMDLDGPGR